MAREHWGRIGLTMSELIYSPWPLTTPLTRLYTLHRGTIYDFCGRHLSFNYRQQFRDGEVLSISLSPGCLAAFLRSSRAPPECEPKPNNNQIQLFNKDIHMIVDTVNLSVRKLLSITHGLQCHLIVRVWLK